MARRKESPRARAAVVPFPAGDARYRISAFLRLAPSPRSILVAAAIAALACGAYASARTSSVFAVREIRVVGAPPAVANEVRRALRPVGGRSLVAIETPTLDARLASLPDVVSARYDRAYPHTLVVYVRAERPLLVLRRASESWLVSARGRVLRPLPTGSRPDLARVWVPRALEVRVGAVVADPEVRRALRTVRALPDGPLASARTVRVAGEVTLALRNGAEVRLGDTTDLGLKLEVARRVLPLAGRIRYLDVSVPERPVAAAKPQVEG